MSFTWKSFLLRPQPDPSRTLDQFRTYTKSWQRPAEMEPRAHFREWSTDEGPPSHSVPPHVVAKAADLLDPAAAQKLHWALFDAYFAQNRDITRVEVLLDLWTRSGLHEAEFARAFAEPLQGQILQDIVDDHREAVELGVSGVPAVRLAGTQEVAVGAQPTEVYRRWIEKASAAGGR